VSEADTVSSAVRAVRTHTPDWILLDLMLPDGYGLQVLRATREVGLPTRFCIVTGCAAEMLNEARRSGAEFTFTKPLDVDQLMSALRA
jgi:DNA-binding response OmpR family regulator